MSRTIFFYIFKDLIRIFLLTSGALAGIMSFGGLLRPLTEHGLDASQAASMLSYFMPAMTTYSLPIAALFATTVVYGRLAADNELVACRAAGMSYISIAQPAVVLGLTVALISLLFLCFIVPVFTLKVEQVIYSNLAQLISNRIERTHQIPFKSTTIFAQSAAVAPPDAKNPDEQRVSLNGVMIISYEKLDATSKLQIPREFSMAKQATIFIRRIPSTGEFMLEAVLERPGGAMFPRNLRTGDKAQGGVQTTQFGPITIDSLIREETKFMDIRRLHELNLDLGKSRKIQEHVRNIVQAMQESQFLTDVAQDLQVPGDTYTFQSSAETYQLMTPRGSSFIRDGRLTVAPGRIIQTRNGNKEFEAQAGEIQISAKPLADDRMSIRAQLRDVTVQTAEGPSPMSAFARSFVIPMPTGLKELESRGVNYWASAPGVPEEEQAALRRERIRLSNGIQSEMHSRSSFAVSCLILVVVGCCLGMMFRSGNFLTAFAISVIPALVCIALIVAGQHTCENVPFKLDKFENPLNFGLALIWSGNAAVLALAVALGWKLQKQ